MALRTASDTATQGARERILAAAYQLFSTRGIRGVGIDEVIEQAGVAKATLYRHFPSKDDLVLAFLQRRVGLGGVDWIEREVRARGATPEEQLFSIFDVFDEWFHQQDFEGCSYVRVLLEMGPTHPLGEAGERHLSDIRAFVQQLAEEAGLRDPAGFAWSWHLLMKGAGVQAVGGDRDAANRARNLARMLIEEHRPRNARGRLPRGTKRQSQQTVTEPNAKRG
jgi:AcrR family transcriptional regulator